MSPVRQRLGRALRATLAAGVTCAVLGGSALAMAYPSQPGPVGGAPHGPVGGTSSGPGTASGPAGQPGFHPGGTIGSGPGGNAPHGPLAGGPAANAYRGNGGGRRGGNGGFGARPSQFGHRGFGRPQWPCGPAIPGGACGRAIIPAPETGPLSLSGYVVGLSPRYLMLREAAGTVVSLALSPAVSVIDQGLPGSLADVGAGEGVLVTLNGVNEVSLIDITSPAPVPPVPAPAIP
jgi:hypothetical protein